MKATKIFGYNALICLFAGIFNEIFIKLFLDGDSTTKEKIFGALAWCFLFECAFQIVQRFKRIKTLNMLTQKLIEITNQKPSSHILLE
ncbi:MAG: histidine kinase, partial [Ligilactobacillus ruminis]|nr:histidine kinase [Ligilactobacillus ruminis]